MSLLDRLLGRESDENSADSCCGGMEIEERDTDESD